VHSNPQRTPRSWNRRAILKAVILVAVLVIAIALQFPLARIMIMWTEDAQMHMTNNTTWNGMDQRDRTAWAIIPGFYIIGALVGYWTYYRPHRKRLTVNHLEGGVVTYIHGIHAGDNWLYDMSCLLFNGGRHMPWGHVPRPISGDYYRDEDGRDLTVIYYRTELCAPWRWKRLVVDPSIVTVGVFTVWIKGRFDKVRRHEYNPVLNYRLVMDDTEYTTGAPDLGRFANHHEQMLDRIQRTNLDLLRSNPSIMGGSVKQNIMVHSSDRTMESFELLDGDEKARIIEEMGNATDA